MATLLTNILREFMSDWVIALIMAPAWLASAFAVQLVFEVSVPSQVGLVFYAALLILSFTTEGLLVLFRVKWGKKFLAFKRLLDIHVLDIILAGISLLVLLLVGEFTNTMYPHAGALVIFYGTLVLILRDAIRMIRRIFEARGGHEELVQALRLTEQFAPSPTHPLFRFARRLFGGNGAGGTAQTEASVPAKTSTPTPDSIPPAPKPPADENE